MTTLRKRPRHCDNLNHPDALYGAFYPANHLRLVSVCGDPDDCTRGLLTFDRDVGYAPGEVELWVGDRRGFTIQRVNPRVYRADFGCPLYWTQPWRFSPALGSFTGADGCAPVLECSGTFQPGGGATPPGKFWLSGVNWLDDFRLAFAFSTSISVGGGNPAGFWCLDESGNVQYGAVADQSDACVARVVFPAHVPEHGSAGLLAWFDDLLDAVDLLKPVACRF